ncbi:uncharacterized protein LOC123867497 [Maniola jurtina]|uniref:uncharacterized protein LOC123867497 n=1 Tax=Maniola jurtina TaxID=191418 RepID=UPI001E685D30|nr:uncharacterized protein LOC123867497 [Maniola jurtina]
MRISKRLCVVTSVLLVLCYCVCQDQNQRVAAALKIAMPVYGNYKQLFTLCLKTSMSNQRFLVDNLHSYINAFSKTTVGYAPQFTGNRKFFANMINTAAFKNTLEKDVATIQRNFVEKMKFCDSSVMDTENLRQYYDREVDQTKL